MAPPTDEGQTNLGYQLRTTPAAPVTVYRDGFGNRVDLFNLLAPYRELVIRATSIVRMHRVEPSLARLERVSFEPQLDEFRTAETIEYLLPSPLVKRCPELDDFVASLPACDGPMSEVAARLVAAVRSRLVYEKKVTTARTPVGEALRLGRGVCQDFAHLLLAACRGVGLPARYVSGYLHLPGEVATHAWCQLWAAGSDGWTSTRPMALSPTMTTSRSPSAATIPTCPPTAASGRAGPRSRSPSASRSTPSSASRPTGAIGLPHRPRGPRAPGSGPSAGAADPDRLRQLVVPPAAGATAAVTGPTSAWLVTSPWRARAGVPGSFGMRRGRDRPGGGEAPWRLPSLARRGRSGSGRPRLRG